MALSEEFWAFIMVRRRCTVDIPVIGTLCSD
jgi:hypothetical protein